MEAPSLRSIFESELNHVCRTLRRLGVPERDLEDAAQETFLALHGKLDTYDPTRPLRAWVIGFAFRVAANRRRKKTPEPVDDVGDVPAASANPEQSAVESQAKTLAMRALQRMDPDRREVLVMHDLEGFAVPEIAQLLTVPLNTVYSRLRVAREEFENIAGRMASHRGDREERSPR